MKAEKSINALTDQVEELLGLLEMHPSPDIDAIRYRIEDALDSVRVAVARSHTGARIRRYASSIDRYVTGYPRLGFLTGALLGAGVVYLSGLRRPDEE